MDSNIDNKYISNAIDELINLLGIKEEIPKKTILKPFRAGNIKGCIENIANYLGLPIVVSLSYVAAKYQQRNVGNRFESTGLARTDRASRGVEGITAQVSIPSYLPLYGTSSLENFPIAVKISDNCLKHSETFMAVMAHELSHVLLHALWHKEKDNEFYADLTAMILGFSRVLKNGRKVVETKNVQTKNYILYSESVTETLTTTYGYLSDEQFNLAFDKIDKISKKYVNSYVYSKKKLLKRLTDYKKQQTSYKKELFRFNKFIEYLDKNENKTIRQDDLPKIVLFHQLHYADEFTAVIRSNQGKLKEIDGFCAKLLHCSSHYTQQRLNSLQRLNEEIDILLSDLKRKFDSLHNDVSILTKYVSIPYKLKINRQTIP